MIRKSFVISVCVIVFLLLPLDVGAGLFRLREKVFPNGMTIVTIEDHSSPVVTFQAFVDASVRKEKEGITGISHFAEHYFFLGSKNIPPGEISRIVASWGGYMNAYTGFDYTSYYMSVPKVRLDKAVELFSDMFLNKTYPKDYFDSEMKVVQEERRLLDNNPKRKAFLDFQKLIFEGSKYSIPIIGHWKDLKRIKLKDVKRYYEDHYAVSDIVFVVAGDLDHGDVVASFERWFGKAKPRKLKSVRQGKLTPQTGERRIVEERKGLKFPFLLIGYRTTEFDHPDYYPLAVLSSILSDGESSRFQKELVRNKKLALGISASMLHTKKTGAFLIQAEPLKTVSASVLERAIYSEIGKMASFGPELDELGRVIKGMEKSFLVDLQTTSTKADITGRAYMLSKDKSRYNDNFLDNLRKVTQNDVRRVAAKYLNSSGRNVLALLPENTSYWAAELKDLKTENFTHSKVVEFPNGIKLLYQFSEEVPAVFVKFLVSAGSSSDPRGKEGVACLTANLVGKGTKLKSEDEIADLLDRNAISFSSSISNEAMSFNMDFLKDKAGLAFEIAADVLTNFSANERVFDREKKRLLSSIETDRSNPKAYGYRALARVLFGKSRLSHDPKGYIRTVKGIRKRDVEKYYRNYFGSGNITISVVGDIGMQYLVDLIGEKFADFPKERSKGEVINYGFETRGVRYYLVDVPWSSQAYIFAGGKGLARRDPSFTSARVMNYILGGAGLSSRLMSKLRTEMGLAYNVFSYFDYYKNTGTFNFLIQTKVNSTKTAIDGFLNEVVRFAREGALRAEFDDAKSYYEGVLPFRIETIAQKASEMANGYFYGIGPDSVYDDVKYIEELKLSDVNREALRFKTINFAVVIVGPRDKIKKEMAGMGPITELKASELF